MPQGMSEVESFSGTLVEWILLDDGDLDRHRLSDLIRSRHPVCSDRFGGLLQ